MNSLPENKDNNNLSYKILPHKRQQGGCVFWSRDEEVLKILEKIFDQPFYGYYAKPSPYHSI